MVHDPVSCLNGPHCWSCVSTPQGLKPCMSQAICILVRGCSANKGVACLADIIHAVPVHVACGAWHVCLPLSAGTALSLLLL